MRLIIATTAVILLTALTTPKARAERQYDRAMHRLAAAMENTADELRDKVKRHFHHRNDYGRLVHIASTIERNARQIERLVEQDGSPHQIRADIAEINRNILKFNNILRQSDRGARYYGESRPEHRYVGDDLYRLEKLVHEISNALNHSAVTEYPRRPPVRVSPAPRPAVVYGDHPRAGLSIGGRWGRAFFRF